MKYVVVTSMNKDGYDMYGRRMLEASSKYWSDDIDFHVWYHDWDMLSEPDLPKKDSMVFRNLNKVGDLLIFRERMSGYEPTSWRMDAIKFCHKVYAITETSRYLASDLTDDTDYQLIWLDADTLTTQDVTPEWLDSLLGSADISLLERPVTDYAETSFMRFNLNPMSPAAFDVLEDIRSAYDTLEMRGYREWHDGFIFQRIINLHKNHTLVVENLSPDAKTLDAFHSSRLAEKIEHFKGAKKAEQAGTGDAIREIPIIVEPKDSVPDHVIKQNIIDNMGLITNWISRCRTHNFTGLIVSAGPSLDAAKIHKDYYYGKKVTGTKIICVKHSLPILMDAGIVPWGCVVLDPRPVDGVSTHGMVRKDLFKNIDPRTTFFVASMTDPSVTRLLIERGAKVLGFHAFSKAIQTVATDSDFPLPPETVYVTGGTCAATRSIGLLHTLGFRSITLEGFDGSVPEPDDKDKNEKISSHDGKEQEKYLLVKINDKSFWTTGELLAFAQDCERMFDKVDMDLELDFVGQDTLCAETWVNRKIVPLSNMAEIIGGY